MSRRVLGQLSGAHASEIPWSLSFISFTVNPPLTYLKVENRIQDLPSKNPERYLFEHDTRSQIFALSFVLDTRKDKGPKIGK
jgi:hypothetical protein